MIEAGRYSTINELAAAEKINSSYVSRVLRLTLLAPDIAEAILDGRQPGGGYATRADGTVSGGVGEPGINPEPFSLLLTLIRPR